MGVGKTTGIRSKWRIFPQKVMLLQQQYAMADIFKIKAVGNRFFSDEIVRFSDIIVTVWYVASILKCDLSQTKFCDHKNLHINLKTDKIS